MQVIAGGAIQWRSRPTPQCVQAETYKDSIRELPDQRVGYAIPVYRVLAVPRHEMLTTTQAIGDRPSKVVSPVDASGLITAFAVGVKKLDVLGSTVQRC